MIAGIPSYHDYVREKGGPMGRCGACGFQGSMTNGDSGYLCPTCHSMALEFVLVDGSVYGQFRPVNKTVAPGEKTTHGLGHAAA